MDTLLTVGAHIAALTASPASGVLGAAIALGAGVQALRDIASGKVQLKRVDTTEFANINGHRESVRRKIAFVCRLQIAIALINFGLLYWLYVANPIKKQDTAFVPDGPQSVGVIALLVLTGTAIVLEFRRLRLSRTLETLK